MTNPVAPTVQRDAVATSATTVTIEESTDSETQEVQRVRLKLRKPKSRKKVDWTTETVDNEDMNKKKSKCCCIYKKPREFGESSSSDDSDDEHEHCKGHVESKREEHQEGASSTVDGATTVTITETETSPPAPSDDHSNPPEETPLSDPSPT